MKKKTLLKLIFCLFAISMTFATETNQYTIDTILKGISKVEKPYISNGYIVFTAEDSARHIGIAFDFDNYKTIHSFQKLVSYSYDNEETSSIMFYLLKLPENSSKISYRMIIDGLWTTDPNNPTKEYSKEARTWLSTVTYLDTTIEQTLSKPNYVKFVYEGKAGEKIRLSGSFTNWDSFIYYLVETKAGHYELELPLPSGTHYYTFYKGLDVILDEKNPNKVYTPEGRVACVINVQ